MEVLVLEGCRGENCVSGAEMEEDGFVPGEDDHHLFDDRFDVDSDES
jgi:hypothetical protein